MKNRIFTLGVTALIFAACSVNEMDFATPYASDAEEFYATIEDASTRVFVDDDLMVLWHADDRVSIFNKYTYNQQYRFTGNTGANSGSFTKVPNDDFVTGNALNYVYAIYPYKESTVISNQGILTIDLPATQSYVENSFGVGANTMVSCSEGNELLFKNLCGYIMLKLYGDNVTVKSISIKGNNDEPLAGKATVNASLDNAPTIAFDVSAAKEITLTFDTPVTLGTTAETATSFWLVVPPTTFSKGITLTVKDDKNGEFEKSTTANLQISRNTLKRMSALEVIPDLSDDVIVFADEKIKNKLVAAFDTNGDGEISYKEAAAVTSIEGVFGAIKTYTSFDEFQYFTGVKTVAQSQFEDWNLLCSIQLPNSLVEIGERAFKNCVKLARITISNNVTDIRSNTFENCESLSSIVIPNSVNSIGFRAFYNCYNLLRIDLPENLTTLYGYSFENCRCLSSVTIPNNVSEIMTGTFSHCESLKTVFIPTGLTSIGAYAFDGCSQLLSIEIPDGITSIGKDAFKDCNQLSEMKIQTLSSWLNVSLPTISSHPFGASHSGHLFIKDTEAVSVTIPENTQIIGDFALYGCNYITSIILPESISAIGQSAFGYCINLTSINIPDSVSIIGDSAFYNCSSVSTIRLPDSITKINNYTFSRCTNLTSINIPESVTSIGNNVFYECISLSSITIPESVSSLGGCVFYGCSQLASIVLPSRIKIIEGYSFYGCSSLCSISIPSGVTDIGERAFVDCVNLVDITLPDNLTKIGMWAFNKCRNLESIIIPDNATIGYGAFYGCTNLKSVTLPPELSYIDSAVFGYCENLRNISIPQSVKTINSSAFSHCFRLSSIELSDNISYIGDYAFSECTGLSSITIYSKKVPSTGYQSFTDTNNCPIYVPIESVDEYKNSQYWREYATRIQAIPE